MIPVSLQRVVNRALMQVVDNGPGIAVSEREQVFERFYQIRSDSHNSFGLGLAIVREICSALGATVRLLDAPTG